MDGVKYPKRWALELSKLTSSALAIFNPNSLEFTGMISELSKPSFLSTSFPNS